MISDDLIITQFMIGDVEHDDTLKECFTKGVKCASRLERIKTLDEVQKIGESYGQFLNSSFMLELNRLIADAKESTNGN